MNFPSFDEIMNDLYFIHEKYPQYSIDQISDLLITHNYNYEAIIQSIDPHFALPENQKNQKQIDVPKNQEKKLQNDVSKTPEKKQQNDFPNYQQNESQSELAKCQEIHSILQDFSFEEIRTALQICQGDEDLAIGFLLDQNPSPTPQPEDIISNPFENEFKKTPTPINNTTNYSMTTTTTTNNNNNNNTHDDESLSPIEELISICPTHSREELQMYLDSVDGDLSRAVNAILSLDYENPPPENNVFVLDPDLTLEEVNQILGMVDDPFDLNQIQQQIDIFHKLHQPKPQIPSTSPWNIPIVQPTPVIKPPKVPKPSKPPKLRARTFDLHGMRSHELLAFLPLVLERNAGRVSEIHFITGKGLHSPNGKPVLKPLLFRYCQQHGIPAREHPTNGGVVIVTVPDDFQSSLPMNLYYNF